MLFYKKNFALYVAKQDIKSYYVIIMLYYDKIDYLIFIILSWGFFEIILCLFYQILS